MTMTMTLEQSMQCARNLAIGSDSLLSQCLDVIDAHIAGTGKAVACRYRYFFGGKNGGWLNWAYLDQPTITTLPGDATQVELLYTHPVVVPDGWVLVPREPTQEMVSAGGRAQGETLTWGAVRACYGAMLAAAPSAPQPEVG